MTTARPLRHQDRRDALDKIGSELFVVYSDVRTTLGPGVPELLNRSVAVKLTRLMRFSGAEHFTAGLTARQHHAVAGLEVPSDFAARKG